jgi:hypothetical protein
MRFRNYICHIVFHYDNYHSKLSFYNYVVLCGKGNNRLSENLKEIGLTDPSLTNLGNSSRRNEHRDYKSIQWALRNISKDKLKLPYGANFSFIFTFSFEPDCP